MRVVIARQNPSISNVRRLLTALQRNKLQWKYKSEYEKCGDNLCLSWKLLNDQIKIIDFQMSRQVKPSLMSKNRGSEQTDQQNILEDTLKLIEQLYKMRLIDRIARPREKLAKQVQINQFANKLNLLHQKMSRIRSQITESNLSDGLNNRNKSIFGSVTNKTLIDWKKYIRLIETRYNEVFVDGSFKHCKKICELLSLKYVSNLQLITVQNWALECLQSRKHQDCC